jgi:predicted acylesterase/phospholipase RssA
MPSHIPNIDALVAHSALVADYMRIDCLPPVRAQEALLASSALPLALVRSRRSVTGNWLIDGGVDDNVPWFPLIESFPCGELIIVSCNPFGIRQDDTARQTGMDRERRQRVLDLKFKPANSRNPSPVFAKPPKAAPFRDPREWPTKVTVVAPKADLGGFLATMNFSSRRTRKWIKEGYLEGLRIFSGQSAA